MKSIQKSNRITGFMKGIAVSLTALSLVLGVTPVAVSNAEGKDAVTIGDTGYKSLQEAFDAVKDGDTITLQDDVKEVHLSYGKDGKGKGVAFTLDLNGHLITAEAPALYIESGSVTMIDSDTSVTRYFYLDKKGLGHVVDSEDDPAYKSADENDKGSFQGGGIIGTPTTKARLVPGIYADGGGIMFAGDTFEMKAGTILGNHTYFTGGGVFVFCQSKFIMSGGTIVGNTSAYEGGGVCVDDAGRDHKGTFIMTGGRIGRNRTEANGTGGGGIYNGGVTSIKGEVEIGENYAIGFGGGICNSGSLEIDGDVVIAGNKTDGYGGGLASIAEGSGKATISGNVEIFKNTCSQVGGAIYNDDRLSLEGNVSITENHAEVLVGGVFTGSYGKTERADSVTISGNTAPTKVSENEYAEYIIGDNDFSELKEKATELVYEDEDEDEEASETGSNISGGTMALGITGGAVGGIIVGLLIGIFSRKKKQVSE